MIVCASCGAPSPKTDPDGIGDCPRCHPHRFHDCHSMLNPGRQPWDWAAQDCGFWRSDSDKPEAAYCGGGEWGPWHE